jgi:hypothetical protein
MPLQATSGAASYDAFGGGVAAVPQYIEDVFGTFLYTGNGSTQTITNGIDLSGKGGLIWLKGRSVASQNRLTDTVKGASSILVTNSTAAAVTTSNDIASFNANGFSLTDPSISGTGNNSGTTYASWTFRKQPKFFDIQTWTGNSTAGRTVAHNLGSVPGTIIIKRIDGSASNWCVYHRSLANTNAVLLNTTGASASEPNFWNSTTPTASEFTLGTSANVNYSGLTYVAYIFAHDAGGFGLTGTDNVISCGSWTATGGGVADVINLGFEPQLILWKRANSTGGNWYISDNMRGMPVQGSSGTGQKLLYPNLVDAEYGDYGIDPTSTGFKALYGATGNQFIYIAIRRGPMKVPTSGTSVFYPATYTGPALGTTSTVTTGWPVDSIWCGAKNYAGSVKTLIQDRLRIANNTTTSNTLQTASTGSETALNTYATFNIANNTGYTINDTNGSWNGDSSSGFNPYAWVFRRAPSFFDEVCYTGTGANTTFTHNLGVVPEMMIVKQRSAARDWVVYIAPMGNNYFACLNDGTFQGSSSTMWNDTTPTSSVFTVGTNLRTNVSAGTYVAYLFATCAGVSKVGSYTGTGTTKQVDCGFTGGARFVLIKRTDSTGDWYVWDTARGIVSGNDPYLLLNSTAAEVTSTDYIDTYSAGFEISSTAPAAINASGGSFIFLAVA